MKYPDLNLGTGQSNNPPSRADPHGVAGPSSARQAAPLTINLATGQTDQPTALDRLQAKAVDAVKGMLGNFADATPFTREGRAKGLATVAAELRGGLLDLQKLVVHAFPDSAQQEAVLGQVGLPTPGMVDQERGMGR